MQLYKWLQNHNEGISEIIGTLLLLTIAVIIFSSLILHVISETPTSASDEYSVPSTHFVGYLTENEEAIIMEHNGGEALQLKDTKIILWKEHKEPVTLIFDTTGNAYTQDNIEKGHVIKGGNDGFWNAGESLKYSFEEHSKFQEVRAIIIDTVSNSVVASGNIQTGTPTYLPTALGENDGGG